MGHALIIHKVVYSIYKRLKSVVFYCVENSILKNLEKRIILQIGKKQCGHLSFFSLKF